MTEQDRLDKVAVCAGAHRVLDQLLKENPKLDKIMHTSDTIDEALTKIKDWILRKIKHSDIAMDYYTKKVHGYVAMRKLDWNDYAAIRILDYVDNAGRKYENLNYKPVIEVMNPFKLVWTAINNGSGGTKSEFFEDMLHLFRQFNGTEKLEKPRKSTVLKWMDKHPSGLDENIIELHKNNKHRIINLFIDKIDSNELSSKKYFFEGDLSRKQKEELVYKWWDESAFHLKFAIRSANLLNEMLDGSLDPDIMRILHKAERKGIPFFVNPYYLSLVNVRAPRFAVGADLAIKHYLLYSKELVQEFGSIHAWEKEDIVVPGKPNAAGWLLPEGHNIHRRYPEVAILIPDTVGRACGGLCASCQRMYDFQSGHLNFNLDSLKPKETWREKLKRLLEYYEKDSRLRDILITGGDALMSSDQSLENILNEVYEMALRKKEANKTRKIGEKYAEILRVRIGTRLPVYIPQRITSNLIKILSDFKRKASAIGVKQFLIQTHFETAFEITPEAKNGIIRLINSGWTVTNQNVFITGASRRGHASKLRKVLNDIGVLTYYTFSVKGYMENTHNFATNARAAQEQIEEKALGVIPQKYFEKIKEFPLNAENMIENIDKLKKEACIPFLSTDRNVMNLPGVGKSMTFRVIGITRYGKRILEFDYDTTRSHSPIVDTMEKVVIVESKPISTYLKQLVRMGEDIEDYSSIWGYSLAETEKRPSVNEYPEYDFKLTDNITNIEI